MPSLEIVHLELPFKHSFEHAAAKRAVGDSVLVTATDEQGIKGYGEGCPRPYVTGETWETASAFFGKHASDIASIRRVEDIERWVRTRQELIDRNPAAWCAVELALLDLFGQQQGMSVESLLELPELTGAFTYSAILGASDPAAFQSQVMQYQKMGFTDFKVKVVGDLAADKERLDILGEAIGRDGRVRLDANNIWNDATQAISSLKALGMDFFAIEEPLAHGQYEALAQISRSLDVPIILDESLLREEQLDILSTFSAQWIVNLRVSKMGGLFRSMRIAAKANERDIKLIVGAHVGESGILSRAALSVANAFREHVVAQEGAFGTFLLEKDITIPAIQFGFKGELVSEKIGLAHSGFGIRVHGI